MKRSTSRVARFAALAIAVASGACSSSSGGGGSPPAPPPAPTGLSATAGSGAVSLTWTPISGATTYGVYRGAATGALAAKTRIASGVRGTAYVDAAVTDGTAYFYQVTSSNEIGESSGSSEVAATPSAALAPAPPAVFAGYAGNANVALLWDAVPGATSYNLYWSTTSGVTPASGARITLTQTMLLHTGRANGTTYYYVVTAQSPNGESLPSPQVRATPSDAPYVRATAIYWPAPVPANVPVLQVQVCTDVTCMTPIPDATVTVNGTSLPYDAVSSLYDADGPLPGPGAPVSVSVIVPPGGPSAPGTYAVSTTQYSTFPAVTSPASGATWQRATEHAVTWTAGGPTAGSEYVIGIQDDQGRFYPGFGSDPPVIAPTTSTSYTIPAGSITAPGSYTVFVGIATIGVAANVPTGGIPIPSTNAGSGLWIGAVSAVVPIAVQ